jgi:hypothetical protein
MFVFDILHIYSGYIAPTSPPPRYGPVSNCSQLLPVIRTGMLL